MQHIAVGIGLRAGGKAFGAQKLAHDSGNFGAAQVAAHGLRPGDPVVAAGALHCVVALINQHHDRVAMRGLDRRAFFLVREPGIARDFADAGEIGAERIGQRFDRLGIGRRIGRKRLILLRHLAVLKRHHAAEDLQKRHRKRCLEGEAAAFALGLVAQIAVQRALEERRALGHPRNFVVKHERGWSLYALDRLHWVCAEMRGASGAAVAFPARLRTVDAPPIAEPFGRARAFMQGQIGCQCVVGGDSCDRETLPKVWVFDALAGAEYEACQNRKPFQIEQRVSSDMRARRKAHVPHIVGEATRDLGGAHLGDGGDGFGRPLPCRIIRFGTAGMFHQDHEREFVRLRGCATQPRIRHDLADPGATRIQEIGAALEIGAAAFQIVRHRCLARRWRSGGNVGED